MLEFGVWNEFFDQKGPACGVKKSQVFAKEIQTLNRQTTIKNCVLGLEWTKKSVETKSALASRVDHFEDLPRLTMKDPAKSGVGKCPN